MIAAFGWLARLVSPTATSRTKEADTVLAPAAPAPLVLDFRMARTAAALFAGPGAKASASRPCHASDASARCMDEIPARVSGESASLRTGDVGDFFEHAPEASSSAPSARTWMQPRVFMG